MRKSNENGGAKNGGGRRIPMPPNDASRVQAAEDKNPSSRLARTGFGPRAQSSGARKEGEQRHG
ncbi:hypothetical protein ACIOHE_07060 [Streptomyces sp. NPDC087851]|uniref:hypothetical protein n=1 Tax=Streptomyces sp. NPDC087851 TaxID=3365810 RepID=UPI003821B2FD